MKAGNKIKVGDLFLLREDYEATTPKWRGKVGKVISINKKLKEAQLKIEIPSGDGKYVGDYWEFPLPRKFYEKYARVCNCCKTIRCLTFGKFDYED